MRYLLFGSNNCYYAQGGGHDFLDASDNLEELCESNRLKAKGSDSDIEWWHIFDTESCSIVAGTDAQAYGATALSDLVPEPRIYRN